jgi:hypothetical protein
VRSLACCSLLLARHVLPDTNDRIADHYPGGRVAVLVVLAALVMVLCAVTLADEGYGNSPIGVRPRR